MATSSKWASDFVLQHNPSECTFSYEVCVCVFGGGGGGGGGNISASEAFAKMVYKDVYVQEGI